MIRSTAIVTTAHASRYLQQLCKHWSHRFSVHFDTVSGAIDFGDGETVALSASPEALVVIVACEKNDGIAGLETVVADHLNRFGFRETLAFNWQRQG